MKEACLNYRVEWLSDLGSESGHSAECSHCVSWARSAARQQEVLSVQPRVEVPDELATRVESELRGERLPRLVEILGAMIRHPAPPALDAGVALQLRRPHSVPFEVRALRNLEHKRAPDVLSRLLEEELRAPERERVDRFAGNLERKPVPLILDERIDTGVRRRSLLKLVVAPLATLSAAGLMVWMTVRWNGPEPAQRRFTVIHAASADELHPLGRALGEALAGSPARKEPR